MATLFERLDEEEAIVRGELDALREKVQAGEERLARLTITRETALQLLGDQEPGSEAPAAPPSGADAAAQTAGGPEAVPFPDLDELQATLTALTSRFAAQPTAAQPTSRHIPVPRPPVGPDAQADVAAGRLEWAEGMEKILAILATSGRVMRAREITAAIGEDASLPARIETTRGRCKRLVKAGKAVEVEPGCFQIAPQAVPVTSAGEEMPGMG